VPFKKFDLRHLCYNISIHKTIECLSCFHIEIKGNTIRELQSNFIPQLEDITTCHGGYNLGNASSNSGPLEGEADMGTCTDSELILSYRGTPPRFLA
jgi:hypothetical protein